MSLIQNITRDRAELGATDIDTNSWRVGVEKGARNSFRCGEKRVLAMESAILEMHEALSSLLEVHEAMGAGQSYTAKRARAILAKIEGTGDAS